MRIPFQNIDWTGVERVEYKGETGTSFWQTIQLGGLRIRMVEYAAGYVADHWCNKGHIVQCIGGAFENSLENGATTLFTTGMSYVVSDEMSSHKSTSANGAKLFIIDGDFLQ